MSQVQVQVEVKKNRIIVPSDIFFEEYLRSHRDLAQDIVNILVDDIRRAVVNRQNIKDDDKSFFLVNLGGLAVAFKLLRSTIKVAEQIEDEDLEKLNEAFNGLIKSLIKVYYDIKEDLEPFDKISTDVYYDLADSLTVLLDVFISKLGDKISKLKTEKS